VTPPPSVARPPFEVPRPANADILIAPASRVETREPSEAFGSQDGQVFFQTHHERVVLLPAARLEVDTRSVATEEPYASGSRLSVGRAQLQLAGWLGSAVTFDVGADFARGPSLRNVDETVGIASSGDRVIVQLGQFDAPFSLENRTRDRYLDFGDRGAAVRTFALPDAKNQGVLAQGTNPTRNFHWSAAVLNGARGVDAQFDVMARGWVAPFSFRDPEALRDVTIGGSVWTGDRSSSASGVTFGGQTTSGGYTVLDSSLWALDGTARALELRADGRLTAVGLELDAPWARRFGARFEWIWKRQQLGAFDVTDAAHATRLGHASLSGYATYVEVRAWVLGDETILGAPARAGLELPLRLRDLSPSRARQGLLLAARVDYIDETVASDRDVRGAGLGIAAEGATRLTSLSAGGNYWFTRRSRLCLHYVLNHLGGNNPYVRGLNTPNEHELLVRLALAL
jgi:hypothetical protein